MSRTSSVTTCQMCGGQMVPMGFLGNRELSRCRRCGWDQSEWVVPDEPRPYVIEITIPSKLVNYLLADIGHSIAYWAHAYSIHRVQAGTGYGWVKERDEEDRPLETELRFDRAALDLALITMAMQYPRQFGLVLAGMGDAETCDILVQLAVFREIKYG